MEPLKISPLPKEIFSELSCDFLGPLLGSGLYLCHITDEYTDVEMVNSTYRCAPLPPPTFN
jgi:hypothetical protein